MDFKSAEAILVEKETGTVLFEKNSHEKRPIASVTKIMTMLLTMEAIDSGALSFDDIVTVSERAKSCLLYTSDRPGKKQQLQRR